MKGGKFVEAVLKALWLFSGKTLPPARKFKAGSLTKELMNIPVGTLDDALRITITRACDFAYDIASNRGARHDPSEVNPNEIDAAVIIATNSWILAEMIRFSQSGIANTGQVRALLAGLARRRYPLIEEVDGRVYFHQPHLSARQVALLTLWYRYPRRLTKDELIASVLLHHFSEKNAQIAVKRLSRLVDEDASGAMKVLQPGLREAESIIGRDFTITRRAG
jgi:hypothetical protein